MRRSLVVGLALVLALGVLPPPTVGAQPLPPGLREAAAFFNLLGSFNRRNRVYTEARRTQAEVDDYYERLRRALAENLVEGEMTTAPSQKPVRSFIRLTQALEDEHESATAQIEAEKNDARRQFNNEVGANLFDLLVQSPGGKRLVGDIKSTVDELRQSVLLVKAATDGATLDAALQALAERVTSSEYVGNIVQDLGGLLAQEIDSRLAGIISKLNASATGASGDMDEVLGLLAELEGRLDEVAGTTNRAPFSIAGDGSPLSDIRLVKDADAALNVAIDSIMRYGILIGALDGLSDADRESMRDRIRQTLLTSRLSDLGHAAALAQTVHCNHVAQGVYAEVAAGLGRTPEEPREGSKVRYLVCYDNKTGDPVFAALIGPSKSDGTTTTEGTDEQSDPSVTAPVEVHVDVGATDTAVSDQHVSSWYQIWLEPATEGDVPPFATPMLTGGVFDIAYDFEAMTVSGSFDLAYERDDEKETLCLGSPEAFSGTASGSFADLPIIEAITTEAPPADWGLPAEDWWPEEEGDWHIGGSFPVDLSMSGVIVMGCAEYDEVTTYFETPFSEAATVTVWMTSGIDVNRNQGPDHVTNGFLHIHATTNEPRDSNPFWDFSITWSHLAERPVPDPME